MQPAARENVARCAYSTRMSWFKTDRAWIALFGVGAWLVISVGCAAPRFFDSQRLLHGPAGAEATPPATQPRITPVENARQLAMFSGRDGRAMGWRDVMRAVAWADVICLGEQHNDATAHAVQLAVLQDTLKRWPDSTLALEMLERDEQVFTDDYLDELLEQDDFIERTNSANWGGDGTWIKWYQPLIDASKSHESRVIAANAPRRYVRLARTDGYERLRALTSPRRELFALPEGEANKQYRQRFYEVMSQAHGEAESHQHTEPNENAHGSSQHDPFVESLLRAQRVWDATMADSVVRARPTQQRKVLLCIGQFHTDFEGGTVQQIRARNPSLRVLTISMRPDNATELRADDEHRADIIIYTGKASKADENTEDERQPTPSPHGNDMDDEREPPLPPTREPV